MMQNLKPEVLSALQTATALSTLQGEKFHFFHPPSFEVLPIGSYFELSNIGDLYADDQEIGSEVIFQIDLWGKTSLSDLAIGVDDTMTGIDFARTSAVDLYEQDTRIFHKSMTYRIDVSDPTF